MHGIKVLLKHLPEIQEYFKKGKTVVEIGSTRDIGSTHYLAEICTKKGMNLITIDPTESSYKNAIEVLNKFDNPNLKAVNDTGEDFLRTYEGKDICLAYLDGFDIVTDHPHKQSTIDAYKNVGIDLLKDGNRLSAEVHLDATESIYNNISDKAVLCFDDTWKENNEWKGKGATAVPYLLSKGGKLISKQSKPFWKKRKYNHGVLIAITK